MSTGIIIDRAAEVAFTPTGTIEANNVQDAIEEVASEAGGGGSTLPVADTTSLVKGSADPTKEVRLEVDGLTTGTVRVVTVPDADVTLVGLGIAQTFAALQTFAAGLSAPDGTNLTGERFGADAQADGHYSLALGREALARNTQDVVVGPQAAALVGTNGCTVIGAAASAGSDAIAIGKNAVANVRGVAIGVGSALAHQGAVIGLNGASRQQGDFTFCWDTGAGTATGLRLQGTSSTGAVRDMSLRQNAWADPTDATYKSRFIDYVHDVAGAREVIRGESNGSEAQVALGGGTLFKKKLSATASLDFPSIPALSEASLTITVTGAVTTGEPSVALGWSASLPDGVVVKQARVSAADTVSIRLANYTAVSANPAAVTCRAVVVQF